jgi:two-component system, LytTR family, sensor kinase
MALATGARSRLQRSDELIYGFGSPVPVGPSTAPPRRTYRPLILNVAFWTLFGLVQAATWLLSPIGDFSPNALQLIGVALFNAYLWALLTPAIFPLAARICHARGHRVPWFIFVVLVGLIVACVVAILAASVHGGLPWGRSGASPAQIQFRFWALSRWYFQEVVLFFLVFAVGVATDLFRTYQAREHEASRLKAQASQLEAERAELNARLADARLAVLRSQLNPHFLFNTLNAVSALVAKDPVGVRNMIALLSELLRSALTEVDEEIPVAREMELLRLYLEILEIRYQGQLRTQIVVDDAARDALVPRMILQPLVENAMKHGVAPATGKGLIEIRAQRDGEDVLLIVRDSGGAGQLQAVTDGVGAGLRLTRQRLSELYGDDQKLELVDAPGGGTVARIFLPYHTSADLRLSAELA